MLFHPLGSAAGYKVQGVDKSRGVKTSAFSFPELPPLQNHIFFFVTPSGDDGIYFNDAIGDLLHMSTWFTAVFAKSEQEQLHMHYIVALPASCQQWLSKHPTIFRSGRRIPCVTYSRGTAEGCNLSFSQITNISGLKNYLEGPRNRAKFTNVLDPSPRTVWQPLPGNRQEEHPRDKKEDKKGGSFEITTQVYRPACAPACMSLPGNQNNPAVSAIQNGSQGICSVDGNLRGYFDSS